jgi:hypothetical protein
VRAARFRLEKQTRGKFVRVLVCLSAPQTLRVHRYDSFAELTRGLSIRRVARPEFVPALSVQTTGQDLAAKDDDTDSEQSYRHGPPYTILRSLIIAAVISRRKGSSGRSNSRPPPQVFYDQFTQHDHGDRFLLLIV